MLEVESYVGLMCSKGIFVSAVVFMLYKDEIKVIFRRLISWVVGRSTFGISGT